MNICILTRGDIFPTQHGAAVKIVETARALSLLGHPCVILSSDRDHFWSVSNGVFEQAFYPSRTRAIQEWPIFRTGAGWAERLCRRMGYPEGDIFLYTAQFDPAWLVRVLSVGLDRNIDVFHAEFPGYGLCAAAAANCLKQFRGWRGGRQPISSIVQHNIEWVRLREFGVNAPWIKRMEILALRAVDEIITVSEDDRRHLVAVGFDPSEITVVPHGVNLHPYQAARTQRAAIRQQYQIASDCPLLIFHGTLHYWPNTEAIRFIAEQLLPRLLPLQPKLKVMICGMNPPMYYEHPSIVFTGAVDDLPAHISSADVAICPLFAGGGTRLKLLEYMAASLPIVSTTKGAEGIPHAGSIHIADTAEEMVNAIQLLLTSSEDADHLGLSGFRYVQSLSWKSVSQAYVHLYNGLHRGENWFRRIQEQAEHPEEAYLPKRVPSKPRTLLLMINRGCNLKCAFCDLWHGHQRLSLEQIRPILSDAVSIGTQVLVITGGEPLLHPELCEIVRLAKSLGLSVNITTNGTRVEGMFDELVDSGVDSLSFSLDGLKETHERIRGKDGCFDETCSAIRRIRNETEIATSVYFVATSENVHELVDVYRLANGLGARFDFWPVNDAPELAIQARHHQDLWRKAVALISSEQPEVASRGPFYRDSLQYHSGDLYGKRRCLGLVDQYGIDYAGNLIPCCVWERPELVVGNVLDRPLRAWWVEPHVQESRRVLVETGCSVQCFNHSLYEFEDSTGLSFIVEAQQPSAD
ncbi:MAG: radical SAM protein [Myxococcota bacterium]|nr:radical SAM protein [Myxococcota bacterium]